MKRPPGLLALGLALIVAAIGAFAVTGTERNAARLIGALAGAGLVLAVVGAARWARDLAGRHGRRGAALRLAGVAAAMAALFGIGAAVVNIAIDRAQRELQAFCKPAERLPTITERRRLIEDVENDRRTAFLRAFWHDVPWSCYELENQLDNLERHGDCPTHPIAGVPCTCGEERFPEDWTLPDAAMCDHYRMPKKLVRANNAR